MFLFVVHTGAIRASLSIITFNESATFTNNGNEGKNKVEEFISVNGIAQLDVRTVDLFMRIIGPVDVKKQTHTTRYSPVAACFAVKRYKHSSMARS